MTTPGAELGWLLEKLVGDTPGGRHAVLLSTDGLKMCHTGSLTVDQADQLSAIAAGVQSLSHAASEHFGQGRPGVRQSMTEFYGGLLFIVEAGYGAHLAVIGAEDADAGLVGHNMHALVEQLGEHLSAAPRVGGTARL
ncbi:roadblock/LC7 domain-containing protein [Nocardia terpenica]|uniref:Dynein regulation protein LC7 n=1 Tax=Nocardia terpenica TaxID=455432 RepID=A0A164LYT7_9NOCA|nr:roadblock/LC7 domain-containing protein [Nocardia terpenica]ATL67850.1 dynein regulation protein LC7 [Nocardia terpenica]KZM72869.1 dynein regulation protein LC7 [Nocardia terpenica]MBF6061219.1 roadblock/LC7 domain-containing protein [Nocardia terpenica]MBF6105552.1 roadblock/LC7 domain-containing protein [Nocardia terpenica]MBF6112978.1 roadblock/LC7 domain-containing protein [Nocardia terpenica]